MADTRGILSATLAGGIALFGVFIGFTGPQTGETGQRGLILAALAVILIVQGIQIIYLAD